MAKKPTRKEIMKELLDDFRSKAKEAKANIPKAKRKSQEWIVDQMKTIRGHKVAQPTIGGMYMFGYDAKYKDKLPYWDKFPLILCLNFNATHMLGLNLHYLPPKAREVFLEEMIKHLSTKTITQKSKFKINWNKVKGNQAAQHMIKMYLASHVRLGIKEVAPKHWHKAIYLPTQQFVNTKGANISATRAYNDFYRRK